MIAGRGLTKGYDGHLALDAVDVSLHAGETLAVTGPNGAGKTTLVRTLHLLAPVDEGEVRWDGEPVDPSDLEVRRRMAMVAQDPHVFRGTVEDNVALPLRLRGWDRERTRGRVDALLDRFDLDRLRDRSASRISGGETQRLVFARALAPEPDVLFLDEFASNLDRDRVADLEETIHAFAADGGAVAIVTHDAARIHRLADRVLRLRDGRTVERGPPGEIIPDPGATSGRPPGSGRGRTRAAEDR